LVKILGQTFLFVGISRQTKKLSVSSVSLW
jgi:hypothetical protein